MQRDTLSFSPLAHTRDLFRCPKKTGAGTGDFFVFPFLFNFSLMVLCSFFNVRIASFKIMSSNG